MLLGFVGYVIAGTYDYAWRLGRVSGLKDGIQVALIEATKRGFGTWVVVAEDGKPTAKFMWNEHDHTIKILP